MPPFASDHPSPAARSTTSGSSKPPFPTTWTAAAAMRRKSKARSTAPKTHSDQGAQHEHFLTSMLVAARARAASPRPRHTCVRLPGCPWARFARERESPRKTAYSSKHFTQQTDRRSRFNQLSPPPLTPTWSSRDIHPRAHRASPSAVRREREQHRLSKQ